MLTKNIRRAGPAAVLTLVFFLGACASAPPPEIPRAGQISRPAAGPAAGPTQAPSGPVQRSRDQFLAEDVLLTDGQNRPLGRIVSTWDDQGRLLSEQIFSAQNRPLERRVGRVLEDGRLRLESYGLSGDLNGIRLQTWQRGLLLEDQRLDLREQPQVRERSQYDEEGRLLSWQVLGVGDVFMARVDYRYEAGRLTRTETYEADGRLARRSLYRYTPTGVLVEILEEDAAGRSLGRQSRRQLPGGIERLEFYGPGDRLLRAEERLKSDGGLSERITQYDAQNRVVEVRQIKLRKITHTWMPEEAQS